MTTDPADMGLAAFESLTGQSLDVDEVDGLALRVDSAAPVTLGPDPSAASGFSVLFSGPLHTTLPQRIWTLSGEGLALPIFLVPLGPVPGDRMRYEAVFTRVS